jgi:hypothetical protein
MAFGKKKDEPGAAPDAAPEAALEAASPREDDNEPLFPTDDDGETGKEADGADEATTDADSGVGSAPATSAVTYGTEKEMPATAKTMAVGPPEDNTDALLSMFSADKEDIVDNTVVLDLAGDVELADLLEDLQTLAAALGIETSAA